MCSIIFNDFFNCLKKIIENYVKPVNRFLRTRTTHLKRHRHSHEIWDIKLIRIEGKSLVFFRHEHSSPDQLTRLKVKVSEFPTSIVLRRYHGRNSDVTRKPTDWYRTHIPSQTQNTISESLLNDEHGLEKQFFFIICMDYRIFL